MSALGLNRSRLAYIVIYLNKAEVRDKMCRALQFGAKFLSGGHPGTARNVELNTSLARKTFRLLKFLKPFEELISPVHRGTSLLLIFLTKSKYALSTNHLFLDQFVWLGRSGIFKSKLITLLIRDISLVSRLGSTICATALEIYNLITLSPSMRTLLALVKSSMDVVTVIGMLELAPEIVSPRLTGALGFTTSLIACYLLLPSRVKLKKP